MGLIMRQVKGKTTTIFLAILTICLTTSWNAAAAQISVNNSTGQDADFTSIQAAINAAHPGDKIIVKPGIYEENINISKNVTLVSESENPSDTIVQGVNGSDDIFSVY